MMTHHRQLIGTVLVATAALLLNANKGMAQRGGGGGGHGGGGASAGHGGSMGGGGYHGGGGSWNGGGSYHGGGNYYGRGGYYGYGRGGWGWGVGIGWGWPGYGWGWPGYGWDYGYPAYYGDYYSGAPVYPPDYGSRTSAYLNPEIPPPANTTTAHIRVLVPDGAKIWFNQDETSQTGSTRIFETPSLTPGKEYTYEVRARWRAGDRDVTDTKKVIFHSGDGVTVSFR